MHRASYAAEEDLVGLDVNDGLVVVARVKTGRDGQLYLRNAGWAECPAGVPDRVMAAAIRRAWWTAGMPSHTVCAAFRSRAVVLRYFKYPALTREEFEAALRLEAEENLQLPPQEIVLDWHLNQFAAPGTDGAATRPYEGLLAAAPLKEVTQFMAVLRLAGLYPVALDLGATAITNLFHAQQTDRRLREDTCVLHLTRQGADIAVLFERHGLYARTVFARSVSWESSLDYLAESVKDAFKYYEFKLRGAPVQRLFVTGRLPTTPDFTAQLAHALGVPVEVWDPLARIAPGSLRVKRLLRRRETLPPLGLCIGLALRRYGHA